MQLLVSVSDAGEAREALAGGAYIIDAKNPARGALGVVDLDVFDEIVAAARHGATISAALGDADEGGEAERAAAEFAARGASFVKVGFANILEPTRAARLLGGVVRSVAGSGQCAVVAVAYADASRVNAIAPYELLRVAADAGVRGVLVDTADKWGAGLTALWSRAEIGEWVNAVRGCGLVASVAGRLTLGDFHDVSRALPDVVGVRGAACDGGRGGRVSPGRVRGLREALDRSAERLLLRSQ